MQNPVSFMMANYCARQTGWNMSDWGQGERATEAYFQPVETYRERLNELLSEVAGLGFGAIDLWLAHLDPRWATPDHIRIAHEVLDSHNLKVLGLAGWMGSTPEQFENICKLAVEFGAKVLGGGTTMINKDRPFVVNTLKRYGLKLGLENHPEKNEGEVLEKIGDGGDGTIGACVDTGWFGTQGYDAAHALEALKDHLVHVHLKDVREVGKHETCRFGQGVVDIGACVETLKRIGYTGGLSIEHEPEKFDPIEDVRASFAMLKEWMQ
jgi:L-ribulose-5-phosphate 3-epimerase